MRASGVDMWSWVAPDPATLGSFSISSFRAIWASFALPPAAAIRFAAMPSSSSKRAFAKWAVVRDWWLSLMAIVCAACIMPLARSVNFSIFIL